MVIFTEAPYISALKESYLTKRCSGCFNQCSNKCPSCEVMVYCNDQCRINDRPFHLIECEIYKNNSKRYKYSELILVRMIVRTITRLSIDGGKPEIDLCPDVPESIPHRQWSDLLEHRDAIPHSSRHLKEWLITKDQLENLFGNRFEEIDVYEIFGKILINRFRVGIHENLLNGRVAVGWTIYLTTSRFNHISQPDLLQCSYERNMRLKFADNQREMCQTTLEFDHLTVSYHHENDFRLTSPSTNVPTRRQRRTFVSFFLF